MRWAFLGLFALNLGACARTTCPDRGGPRWREARSEHFRVRTPLSSTEAKSIALELERTLEALVRSIYLNAPIPNRLLDVLAVASLDEYADDLAGMHVRSQVGSLLIITTSRRSEVIIAHELAHYVTSHFLKRQPLWLAEGLATWLETIDVDDGGAEIGLPHRPSLAILRKTAFGFFDPASFLWKQTRFTTDPFFYALSWLFVDYLLNLRGQEFLEYQKMLRQGRHPRVAFDAIYPDLRQGKGLSQALQGYIDNGVRRGRRVDYRSRISPSVEERLLTSADAHAAAAWLHLLGNREGRLDRARAEVMEALAHEPHHADALVLRVLSGTPKDSLELARAATRNAPLDWRTWVLLGNSSTDLEESRRSFHRGTVLSPGEAHAFAMLALTDVRAGDLSAASQNAQRAFRLDRTLPESVTAVAAWLFGVGKCSEGESAVERLDELLVHEGSRLQTLLELLEPTRKRCAEVPSPPGPPENLD